MKTFTREHRDAPVTPRDLIQAARKDGQWPKAMELIQDEARRLKVIVPQKVGNDTALGFDMAKAPLWLLDELASTYLGAELFEDAQPVLVLLVAALEGLPAERRNLVMTLRKLGQCCEVLGDYRAALMCYKRGIDLVRQGAEWDDDSRLWVGYGANLNRMGRTSEGEAAWRESLRRKCVSVEAKYTRAQVLLALGRWEEGWRLYESRKQLPGYDAQIRTRIDPIPALPEWDGKKIGQVHVIMGQGAGDVIHFARYLPEIAKRSGNKVHLDCGEPLRTFLPYERRIASDYVMHLDSAPLLLGMPEPIAPAPEQGRQLESALSKIWKGQGKPRVGVCWKGSPKHLNDKDRSCPFDPRELLQDERWELVSVQAGHDFDPRDYAETAEFMRTLDAVVCVDTSVAHVAGTLGVPTLMIPPAYREWRWGIRGASTPWYPSMTLIRRKTVYDWEDVWERAKAEIARRLEAA